ncbi:protein kinase C and casein kinase substrate in neurons protein [Pelomyxa schiedti]|nr:protein kinase C and casein kinase substrate in neurons protein [Pelomyxa schiedti]
MKTKEDEKKIVEMTASVVQGIKRTSPLFSELVHTADAYMKQLSALSATEQHLGESFTRLSAAQGSEDIDKGFRGIAQMFNEIAASREEWSRSIGAGFVTPFKLNIDNEKREVGAFEKSSKSERDRVNTAVKKAQQKTQKMAKSDNLLQSIGELNERVQEAQKVLLEQLRTALILQRSSYCIAVEQWNSVFKSQEATCSCTLKHINDSRPYLTDLANASKRIPADKEELVKQKVQTLIDLSQISGEWKKVFQEAGVKKSDLRDNATAQFILDTIQTMLPPGVDAKSVLSGAVGDVALRVEEAPSPSASPSPNASPAPSPALTAIPSPSGSPGLLTPSSQLQSPPPLLVPHAHTLRASPSGDNQEHDTRRTTSTPTITKPPTLPPRESSSSSAKPPPPPPRNQEVSPVVGTTPVEPSQSPPAQEQQPPALPSRPRSTGPIKPAPPLPPSVAKRPALSTPPSTPPATSTTPSVTPPPLAPRNPPAQAGREMSTFIASAMAARKKTAPPPEEPEEEEDEDDVWSD